MSNYRAYYKLETKMKKYKEAHENVEDESNGFMMRITREYKGEVGETGSEVSIKQNQNTMIHKTLENIDEFPPKMIVFVEDGVTI